MDAAENPFIREKRNCVILPAHDVITGPQKAGFNFSQKPLTFMTLVTGFSKHFNSKLIFACWPGLGGLRCFHKICVIILSTCVYMMK